MTYLQQIAALPLPTPEQTSAFAAHIVENHSWYKHLPSFPPGAPFVLFPNPHAGESVDEHDGRFVTSEVVESDYFRHHSRFTTAEYRERFGYWDYWVGVHSRVHMPVEGPWIYDAGGRELLAAELANRWSCRVTAFLRAGPIIMNAPFIHERNEFLEYARRNPSDPNVSRYRDLAERGISAEEPKWSDREFGAFMENEAAAQLQILVQSLMTVRAAWAGETQDDR